MMSEQDWRLGVGSRRQAVACSPHKSTAKGNQGLLGAITWGRERRRRGDYERGEKKIQQIRKGCLVLWESDEVAVKIE